MEATIPSLVDPSLVEGAPDGSHVMSVIVAGDAVHAARWHVGRASRGASATGSSRRSTPMRPGLAGLVTARQVLTPLDLERDYGLTGGHPMHGEHGLDQFFLWRPLLGHARYRLALDGLYLAGAGAHPGGGVTGQNGQNAAREIVGDLQAPPPLSDGVPIRASRPAAGHPGRTRRPVRAARDGAFRRASGGAAARPRSGLTMRGCGRARRRDIGSPSGRRRGSSIEIDGAPASRRPCGVVRPCQPRKSAGTMRMTCEYVAT